MTKTYIEYAEYTWNFLRGCKERSPGCANCYALAMSRRHAGMGIKSYAGVVKDGRWTGVVNVDKTKFNYPTTLKTPSVIFVNSMSDTLYDFPGVMDAWEVMMEMITVKAPQHLYLVLTKREDQIPWFTGFVGKPPKNMFLGVSAENDYFYQRRLGVLANYWDGLSYVSAEPLLSDIKPDTRQRFIVAGLESGISARKTPISVIENLVEQCKREYIPLYVKQLGTRWAKQNNSISFKGNVPEEWPEKLRVRRNVFQEVLESL